jgi:hypothetical protein
MSVLTRGDHHMKSKIFHLTLVFAGSLSLLTLVFLMAGNVSAKSKLSTLDKGRLFGTRDIVLSEMLPTSVYSVYFPIRIQDIVDTRCIQHIVDNLNMTIENPHEM